MRFIEYLKEEYETTLEVYGEPVVVYANPSKQDLKNILKDVRASAMSQINPEIRKNIGTTKDFERFMSEYKFVRFIADFETKKLYAWGGSLAIHKHIEDHLRLAHDTVHIKGESIVDQNGKLDEFSTSTYSIAPYTNANWLKPYFNKIEIWK